VLAVDDQASFRTMVRQLVDATSSLELVGEAASGEAAVKLAGELRPSLVLMDVRMPGLGGIAAAREIKAVQPSTVVLLLSTTHPDELPPLEYPADGIVWKGNLRPKQLDEFWRCHR
jgi:DNA-binding NarL/FixJ family response regulator